MKARKRDKCLSPSISPGREMVRLWLEWEVWRGGGVFGLGEAVPDAGCLWSMKVSSGVARPGSGVRDVVSAV